MARKVKIKLETTAGAIDRFRVTVGNDVVITADGTQTPVWRDQVPDAHVVAKFQAVGMAGASYKLTIDLENVMTGQSLELSLVDGYSELQLVF